MEINGISDSLVNKMVKRSNRLGQGRQVAAIGFVDEEGIISGHSRIIDGGVSGIPHRLMLAEISHQEKASLLEMINSLPENAVYVTTDPGQTGIIVSTSSINLFGMPVVKIGIKHQQVAGIGILHPRAEHFRLATRSERAQLDSLAAATMEEERSALRGVTRLRLKFLEISQELKSVECEAGEKCLRRSEQWTLDRVEISSIEEDFARELVQRSMDTEPGREVAAYGDVDEEGHITRCSDIIVGGMGYIPSRLLASAYRDIEGLSLREFYTDIMPADTVIVHTHPGGSGVMHMSDAMAGPGTWGRPILAVGHNEDGEIKGVMAVQKSDRLFQLADENEELEQRFFEVEDPETEVKLRKKRYSIAQEFTDLCQQLELRRR